MQALWGAKELACFLGVSENTARRWMRSGSYGAFQLEGKLWRVRPEMVREAVDKAGVRGPNIFMDMHGGTDVS